MALVASGGDVLFETIFAVQLAIFFHEADVLQWSSAGRVNADEMFRTPDTSQCGDKWTPNVTFMER